MQDETLLAGIGGEHPLTVEEGPDAREVALAEPTVDLDGDGILDTRVFQDADGTTIASDLDEDGWVDHLTRLDEDGSYAAWEPRREADGTVRWERVDDGQL